MASILVTGANGFVGRALCNSLLQHGHDVRGAVRSGRVSLNPEVSRIIVGDIDNQTDWTSALTGVDVVIHLAARVHVMSETSSDPLTEFRKTNVYGTEHLARSAAACGVRRIVFVSSIKVNGEETMDSRRYSETDLPAPQDPYGVSKWEAEHILHRVADETGLELVVVRPPLVYGDGVKGNFKRMLNALSRGIPLPLASIKNLRSLIYVENLADALRVCSVHPAAAGNVYMPSDGEDISTPDLLRKLGLSMGKPAKLFCFPVFLLTFAGWLLGKSGEMSRLLGSLQIDSIKIQHDLNWHPPCSLQHGLQVTAAGYLLLKS